MTHEWWVRTLRIGHTVLGGLALLVIYFLTTEISDLYRWIPTIWLAFVNFVLLFEGVCLYSRLNLQIETTTDTGPRAAFWGICGTGVLILYCPELLEGELPVGAVVNGIMIIILGLPFAGFALIVCVVLRKHIRDPTTNSKQRKDGHSPGKTAAQESKSDVQDEKSDIDESDARNDQSSDQSERYESSEQSEKSESSKQSEKSESSEQSEKSDREQDESDMEYDDKPQMQPAEVVVEVKD